MHPLRGYWKKYSVGVPYNKKNKSKKNRNNNDYELRTKIYEWVTNIIKDDLIETCRRYSNKYNPARYLIRIAICVKERDEKTFYKILYQINCHGFINYMDDCCCVVNVHDSTIKFNKCRFVNSNNKYIERVAPGQIITFDKEQQNIIKDLINQFMNTNPQRLPNKSVHNEKWTQKNHILYPKNIQDQIVTILMLAKSNHHNLLSGLPNKILQMIFQKII